MFTGLNKLINKHLLPNFWLKVYNLLIYSAAMSEKTFYKFVMSKSFETLVAELESVDGYEIHTHDGEIVDGGAWKLRAIWKYDGVKLNSTDEKEVYSIIKSPNNTRICFKINQITIADSQKKGEGIYGFSSLHSPYFNKYHEYFEQYCPLISKIDQMQSRPA